MPLALHVLSGDAGERVVYGDSRGAAVLLLCGSRELPARDLISTDIHKVGVGLAGWVGGWVRLLRWVVGRAGLLVEVCAVCDGGRPQTSTTLAQRTCLAASPKPLLNTITCRLNPTHPPTYPPGLHLPPQGAL